MSEVIKVEIVQKMLLTVSGCQILRCFVQGTCIKTHTCTMYMFKSGYWVFMIGANELDFVHISSCFMVVFLDSGNGGLCD